MLEPRSTFLTLFGACAAVPTRQVPKDQTTSVNDVQLTLDPIGATLPLLDRAIWGETVVLAADDLLQKADRRHVRQAGAKLGDKDEDRKHGDDESW